MKKVSATVCDRNAAEEIIYASANVSDACLAHDFLDEHKFIALLEEISDNDMINSLISGFAYALLTRP